MNTKKTKKINYLRIIRAVFQLISFLLLPALFSSAFAGIKYLVQAVTTGNITLTSSLKVSIILIILSALFGRYFGGWMCVFGSYNDLICSIRKRIYKKDIKITKADKYLRFIKYIILITIIVLCVIGYISYFQGTSPWDVFGNIITLRNNFNGYTIGIILFILITAGAAFIERFFCRYICPLGAIFALLDKVHLAKIAKPNDACGKCRNCTNHCPMGINLAEQSSVKSGECIKCMECANACKRDNVELKIFGLKAKGLEFFIIPVVFILMKAINII